MEHKICSICENKKNINNFYKHKGGKGGYHSQCKECYNKKFTEAFEPCLYQIRENNKIVYIGITKNYKRRINNHKSSFKNNKTFNYSFLANEISTTSNFEWELIEKSNNYNLLKIKELELLVKYRPKYNSPYREYFESLVS